MCASLQATHPGSFYQLQTYAALTADHNGLQQILNSLPATASFRVSSHDGASQLSLRHRGSVSACEASVLSASEPKNPSPAWGDRPLLGLLLWLSL